MNKDQCTQAENLNKELAYPMEYISLDNESLLFDHFIITKGKYTVRSILGDKKVDGYEIYTVDYEGGEDLDNTKHTFRAALRYVFEEHMRIEARLKIERAIHKLAL